MEPRNIIHRTNASRWAFPAYGVFLLASAAILVSATVGCSRSKDVAPPLPIAVQVETLKQEPILQEVRFSATVRERHRVELSFKVPGTIDKLLQVPGPDGKMHDVHEGDIVTNDSKIPLAQLDDSDYRRREAGARQQLAQAEAKAAAVQATLIAVNANYDRIKPLSERGSVPTSSLDDVTGKRDATKAELTATERAVDAAKVALEQAEDDLKNCCLVCPIPKGIVSRKYVEDDERVPAGKPVFEIMDLTQVKVAFGVPDTQVSGFQLGQEVSIMADAFRGEHFTGQVTKIQPAADLRTRTFEVEVTIDDPKQLKPGMVVTILVGKREEMTLVPMTAIQRGESTTDLRVFTIVDEQGQKIARKRRVKLDGIYDNRIRLVEGEGSEVKAGDVIVVTGTFRLTDGQPVRVIESQQLPINLGN
jgi:multidrug efflux system membrane fusion protein